MSLLGKGARSDSASALNVLACGVARPEGLGCTVGIHCRVPGRTGAQIVAALKHFFSRCTRGPTSEVATVAGEEVMLHSVGVERDLVYAVCTQARYPRRVVFGGSVLGAPHDEEAGTSGLLTKLARESFDLVGLALAPRESSSSSLVGVDLPARATQVSQLGSSLGSQLGPDRCVRVAHRRWSACARRSTSWAVATRCTTCSRRWTDRPTIRSCAPRLPCCRLPRL